MIKYVLRNMWRRKARTLLTMAGIFVGIFALTALGALSARLNQQVSGAESWYATHITVVPSGGGLFGGGGKYFDISRVEEVAKVPGVESAAGSIGVFVDDSQGFSFGAPDLLVGVELDKSGRLLDYLEVGEGRMVAEGDRGKVTVGSTLAEKLDAKVGEEIEIRGKPFEVVGIMEPTLSAPDQFAFGPYQDALALFFETNPFIEEKPIAVYIDVIAESGVDYEVLADRIDESIDGVRVISPEEAQQQISQFSLIFNAILLGIGLIALVVGGLSIINTMVMSVSERTQEIGLKKAIGAETRSVLYEYLMESAIIGFVGGVTGVAAGVVLVTIANNITSSRSSITIFAVTPMVVLGPIIFAVVLGTLAGLFPAFRAARMKPVESLRGD